jgi:hypothetical protein
VNPVARRKRARKPEEDDHRGGYKHASKGGVGDAAGLQHDRDGEDRDQVGDRDLCHHAHHRRSVDPCLL